eukprot:gene2549-3000_t
MADGGYARLFDCETRIGGTLDIMCDRINCAGFYIGLAWLQPEMVLPVSVYLFNFMVIDMFLSLAFLAWPIRSPNYFYVVDARLYRWNWSKPAKALNSALFAVLLLVTGWWQVGLVIALALVALPAGPAGARARGERQRDMSLSLAFWTFGVSIASALFPLINMEVILGGMAATVGGHAFTLAAIAGAGQTVGKIVWYEATRR